MTAEELSKLTPEQKRIAIAEADGWVFTHIAKEKKSGIQWKVWKKGAMVGSLHTDSLPRYCDDLNDIHAAIIAKPMVFRKAMRGWLYAVTDQMSAHFAEAHEIADAFLLTIQQPPTSHRMSDQRKICPTCGEKRFCPEEFGECVECRSITTKLRGRGTQNKREDGLRGWYKVNPYSESNHNIFEG